MVHLLEYDELNELLGKMIGGAAARFGPKIAMKRVVNAPVRKMKADNKAAKTLMKQDYKALKTNINK